MNFHGVDQILSGKSALVGPVVAATFGGVSRLAITAQEYSPTGLALWVLACGVAGAFFTALPKLVGIITGAKYSQRVLIDSETKSLIDRMHTDYKAMVREAQFQKNQQKRIAALERRAKHNVLNAYGALALHANQVMRDFEQMGGKPEPFTVKSYTEMVGEEDEKIERILAEHCDEEEEK